MDMATYDRFSAAFPLVRVENLGMNSGKSLTKPVATAEIWRVSSGEMARLITALILVFACS